MVDFSFEALLGGGPQSFLTGITDLDIEWHDGSAVLYAVSGPSGGVISYRLLGDGTVQLLGHDSFAGTPLQAAPGRLEAMSLGAQDILLTLGWHDDALNCFDLNGSGEVVGTGQLNAAGSLSAAVVALETLNIGGTSLVYASHWGRPGLTVYEVGAGNQLTERMRVEDGEGPQGSDLVAVEAVGIGGQSYLIAASAFGDAVISYRLTGAGDPVEADRLGAADGLGIDAPTALVPVTLPDGQYLLLAAGGSSSLSILRMAADGGLSVTDHIVDDASTTRIRGVTALETVTIGDRVIAVAGGGDDGLSLFTVLPGGRLLHLAQIADSEDTALANVTALAIDARGDGMIDIFASSESEAGISQFSVDLGTLLPTQMGGAGDDVFTGSKHVNLMIGGAGDDNLDAWDGDDILMDGAGADTLRGGRGADIFVMSADGETDTIVDFTLGVDRLDLSALSRIHSLAGLKIIPTFDGALIMAGGEETRLISTDYMPLPASAFKIGDLIDMVHYNLAPVEFALPLDPEDPGGTLIEGGPGNDVLSGQDGDDTLIGGDGADSMAGGAGVDLVDYSGASGPLGVRLDGVPGWAGAAGDVLTGIENLLGGAFRDTVVGSAAANRISGGGGNDTVFALGGDDWVDGGSGDDLLFGQDGDDTLIGGDGADTLLGGAGADTLDGGAGTDTADYSGSGRPVGARLDGLPGWGQAAGDVLTGIEILIATAFRDTVVGSDGANLILTGSGADRVYALGGDDTVLGGSGDDLLYGQGGDDTLIGGDGADSMAGGAGVDLVDYSGASGPLGVRLDGVPGWAGAAGDVLTGIENLLGGAFRDTVVGSAAANRISGGGGNDTVFALGGDDTVLGGSGDDLLYGQGGDDTLIGGDGADSMAGGAGIDLADYSGASGPLGVRLDGVPGWAGAAGDVLTGIENLLGGAFRDTVVGSAAANRISGGGGNDTVFALGGDDVIDGGSGDDLLYGQGGDDRFVFVDGFGQDVIGDFNALSAAETIDLSGLTVIASYAALTGGGHMTQQGADVVIDDFAGNSITLRGVVLADLDSGDFIF